MPDTIPGVDLTGDRYTVKQSLLRNKYVVKDGDGDVVLRAKQKLLKLKEKIPFRNAEGEDVFTVKAKQVLDIAGDYALTTPGGEPVAVLEKQFTMLKHRWKVRHPRTEEVMAELESGSAAIEAVRNLHPALSFVPHSYTITGPGGQHLGTLSGKLSVRDTYVLELEDPGSVPREPLVAAAIAIDALEGN